MHKKHLGKTKNKQKKKDKCDNDDDNGTKMAMMMMIMMIMMMMKMMMKMMVCCMRPQLVNIFSNIQLARVNVVLLVYLQLILRCLYQG
jgi:hypothetical protein